MKVIKKVNMQKGFIQLGIVIVVLITIGLAGGLYYIGSNVSNENTYPQSELLDETESEKIAIEQNSEGYDNSVLCNGTYYTKCKDNLKFICPKNGEAYCEPVQDNSSTKVTSNTLLCNGKQWSNCSSGQNFYCPPQGDAQCLIQNQATVNPISNSQISSNQASNIPLQLNLQQVENLLQKEITKQNNWFEEYLTKQAEIDALLKPIHEEEDRITDQYMAECIQFVTGQLAAKCDQLTLRLHSLEAEASRISGIYPERETLPKSSMPQYQQWRFDATADGLSGTIWSPNSTTRYRWSCLNPSSCILQSY